MCHSKFTELCNITGCCWYLWSSAQYIWAELRGCFPSCPDFLTPVSSVPPWPCSLFKCWSVANTSSFSTVCSWIQDLITVAFEHSKVWPRQMNLPGLARSPGSHLVKWKIQAVPGKSRGLGAMTKRRDRRNHSHQQWIKNKEPRYSLNKGRSTGLLPMSLYYSKQGP